MCWSSGRASSPTRRASCPSRSRSLVCKIPIALLGLSETKPIGYREVDALTGKVAPVAPSHRHLQHLLYRFLHGARAETPQGSQLACASGHVATRIRPITGWPSLFPTPLPASSSDGLTAFLP